MANSERVLLQNLPAGVRRKVEELSDQLGATPMLIVERAVDMYARMQALKQIDTPEPELEELLQDPDWKNVYEKIMRALARRRASKVPKEDKQASGRAGYNIRFAGATKEERIEASRRAANLRWEAERQKKKKTSSELSPDTGRE